ncbi:MAG: class I SAM-dependent methyltransferase [Caulobacteraceae bacterium]
MSWNEGYVADVPYTSGYYREMAPTHQALAALLAGVMPPDPSGPYRFLELGCGTGVGLCVLAAANPQAEFVGVDFMPIHVAAARRLIATAGLTNVRILEASFETLARGEGGDLGQFDFAALHGVYTWISEPLKQDVVRLLDRHLAPGGLVYVGYNNMVGWAPSLPTQKMLIEQARRVSGDSPSRTYSALATTLALQAAKAPALAGDLLSHQLKGKTDALDTLPPSLFVYMAHEYLNEHWRPLFITDVARDLAAAKLSFVGRCNFLEVMPELVLSPEQERLLRDCPDPLMAELQTDMMSPTAFRRDLFGRGATRLSPQRREELLRKVSLGLIVTPEDVPMTVPAPSGDLDLDEEVYAPLIRRLAEGPATVDELIQITAAQGGSMSSLELISILVGAGGAAPLAHAGRPDIDVAAIGRFNVAMIEALRDHSAMRFCLASPLVGGGIDAPIAHCLAYLIAVGEPRSLGGMDTTELEQIASDHEELWTGLRMLQGRV